jgi:hypothetical protein
MPQSLPLLEAEFDVLVIGAGHAGTEVSGTTHRCGHFRPSHGKAHRRQLAGEQIADPTHPSEVLGATGNVHRLLEQCDVVVVMRANVVAHARLGRRQDHRARYDRG